MPFSHTKARSRKIENVRRNSLYDPRYKSIIRRLVKARRDAGLSQSELGQEIGLGQPEVSKIEKCIRKIEVLTLIDWVKATGCTELDVAAHALDNTNAKD